MLRILFICLIFTGSLYFSSAQGPAVAYYHNYNTELSWAGAAISFNSGSKQKVPFFPVININYCPYGTGDYSKDVNVSGKIVFLSNYNLDKKIENNLLEGKVVLMAGPDENESGIDSLQLKIIRSLCRQRISAIVLYAEKDEDNALNFSDEKLTVLNIPIVFVSKSTVRNIFEASGFSYPWLTKINAGVFTARELICSFHLKIKGDFEKAESEFSTIRYNTQVIDSLSVASLMALNDSAQVFLQQLFKPLDSIFPHQTVTIFSDYDEKIFYTFHWGKGLATQNGNFSIIGETVPAYQLAVHEMTHTLFYENWGESSPFLSEGIAMFAEAKAGNPDNNHTKTWEFFTRDELLPLKKLVELDIGSDSRFTEMGYSAAGSFTGFFIETYGINQFLKLWIAGRNNDGTFSKSLNELEDEWHIWLISRFSGQYNN
jgi:hypothetical protein